MADRLHEAFVLRAHGLGPLPFRGKEPAFRKGEIQHYRHRRLSDTELRQLFADRSCNIGVFTGDWHLCLDVDGDEGRQTIKGLQMPPTPMVETGDGFHAHFRTSEPLRTRIKPLPGIDVLGESWQVLMPSSIHPDRSIYRFVPQLTLTDVDFADVPTWIRDLCHTPDLAHKTVAQAAGPKPQKDQDTEDGRAPVVLDTCTTLNPLTPKAIRSLFASDEANRAVADFLGLPELGSTFLCIWHPEAQPSMSLFRDEHSGSWKVHDHHGRGEHAFYGLADLYASKLLGHEVRLVGRPSLTVWWLRALLASKYLEPAEVPMKALPLDARPSIRAVYDGFILLLQAKWCYDPGKPTQFTVRFAMAWCGISSSEAVQKAVWWLVRHGYMRQVKREKGSWTYLPGEE